MSAVQWVNLLVTVTLVEMMAAIGLGVTVDELKAVAANRGLLLRTCIANYVLVPAVAVLLLLLFRAQPLVAAGLLILAVCPGAPFGPPCASLARGNVVTSVGLMAFLAASSAVVAPLALPFLLPIVAGDKPLRVDVLTMVTTLFLTQLLPLTLGLAIRRFRPSLAARFKKPADRLSSLLSLVTFAAVLVVQFPTLRAIRMTALLGMVLLLAATLTIGWVLGGPETADRRAHALTTSLRNVGVGLVIATRAFGGTPAVTAAIAYGVVEIAGSVLVALWWGAQAGPRYRRKRTALRSTPHSQRAGV